MEINPLTVLATLINFGILYLILRKFLYKPVGEAIAAREDEVKKKLDKADDAEKKAEILRLDNEAKLKNAREQGKAVVEDFKVRAEKISEDIINKAKEEATFIVERAKAEAERERDKASEDIKIEAVSLAILLSSKVLETAIDENEHRRLIKDFIAKVGN
jgi:F-type H+-transporting ATPase subunit b